MSKIPHCPDCNLYWYYVSEKEIEVRLNIFAPIRIEKCPFCAGTNEHPPTQQFLDLQKVSKKEMKFEEYIDKYGV